MIKLAPEEIILAAVAESKLMAITQIAEKMVADGLVEADYLKGMLAREQQTSTFLGNGIAIPHGTTDTRNLVKKTGIRVFQFPDGVEWGDNQKVFTAIGIAAKSDEHLAILRQLTHVIANEDLANRLHSSADPLEINSILTGEAISGSFLLNADHVRLNSVTTSYAEAIALTGAILWNKKALLQSELVGLYCKTPVSLGHNVWLTTMQTTAENGGVAIVQPEASVALYGQQMQLLIAVSTRDDQHLPLLSRLVELKAHSKLSNLVACKRAVDIIRLLLAQKLEGEQIICQLAMAHGLHARPAAGLARIAKNFKGELWVENLDSDSPAVSARSVTKLISLGGLFGHRLQITANGPDSLHILKTVKEAVQGGLGDPVVPLSDFNKNKSLQSSVELVNDTAAETEMTEPLKPGEIITGLTGAPGVAIGAASLITEVVFEFEKQKEPASTESDRLTKAIEAVSQQLESRLNATVNTELAQIIAMHLELLLDPEIKQDAEHYIDTGDSAEWGWKQSFEALASLQEQSAEVLLAERAIDIRDVGNRVLAQLTGQQPSETHDAERIVICQEIAPSEISELDPDKVRAVVTAAGGVTSHAAILARSLGIPLLVGCGPRILTVADGTPLIVDCEKKTVIIAPDEVALESAREAMERERRLNEQAYATRFEPATTSDGYHMEIMANLTAAKSVAKAVDMGCEGVGLFRSEFIYMDYPSEPTIEQQTAEYSKVLDSLGDNRPLIVRTLDVGGDKPLTYMPMAEEDNPFLGIRGVRLSLRYPGTLKNQLKALLLAASGRRLRIMFPMVTDITEWRKIKGIYNDVAADFADTQVELGMMIEVPSAALMADVFARELDFFSVGTNDLTQYALAIDRGHPELSKQADSISPSVLRLIDMTVKAANQHGIWVGVCGELASDPLGATILTGLGVKELSMSVRAIPRIKAHLRSLSLAKAKTVAEKALAAESSEAVRNLVMEEN